MPVKIFLHQRVSTGSGVFLCLFFPILLSVCPICPIFAEIKNETELGRIFQTYCLLVASILMLAVAVFPHHHHAERLCLKSDWCTCTSDASCEGHCTHSPNTDNHECTISCATHFAFGHQQLSRSDVSPDFTFSFLIYPMLSLLEYFQTGVIRIGNSDSIYIEKLHSRQWMAAWGLRAPPVFLRS